MKLIHFLVSVLIASSAFALDDDALESPEIEQKKVGSGLREILQQIETNLKLLTTGSVAQQNLDAEKAYESGRRGFGQMDWLLTIRDLNIYLNLTQSPEPSRHLASMYMLGRAYEERGLSTRALRAYSRYLMAYMTYKGNDIDQLKDVLSHALALIPHSGTSKQEVRKFLSSLSTLSFGKDIEPEFLLLLAESARASDERPLALTWIERAGSSKNTELDVKQRILYLQALLALDKDNYESAEQKLLESLSLGGSTTSRDLSRLTLARINTRMKRTNAAISYYNAIPENSDQYRHALIESAYIHLRRGEDQTARDKVQKFLDKFPDHVEAERARRFTVYLDLRANSIDKAKVGIEALDGQLHELLQKLANYRGFPVQYRDLVEIRSLADPSVSHPEDLEQGISLLERTFEIDDRLAEIDSELRGLLMNGGNIRAKEFKPQWQERIEQFNRLNQKLMEITHRYIASERDRLQDKMNPVELNALEGLEKRRLNIFSRMSELRRFNVETKTLREYIHSIASLRDLKIRADKLQASAASLKNGTEKADLIAQISVIHEAISKQAASIRRHRIDKFVNETSLNGLALTQSDYFKTASVELQNVNEIAKRDDTSLGSLASDDADENLSVFKAVIRSMSQASATIKDDIKKDVSSYLKTIDTLQDRYNLMHSANFALKRQTEVIMTRHLPAILNHYRNRIDNRLSSNRKWEADLFSLHADELSKSGDKVRDKESIEQQELDLNLELQTGSEQGVQP